MNVCFPLTLYVQFVSSHRSLPIDHDYNLLLLIRQNLLIWVLFQAAPRQVNFCRYSTTIKRYQRLLIIKTSVTFVQKLYTHDTQKFQQRSPLRGRRCLAQLNFIITQQQRIINHPTLNTSQ